MSKFLDKMHEHNLCSYYLLPLLKLNTFSFGPNNFQECYVSAHTAVGMNPRLYIDVKDSDKIPQALFMKPEFVMSYWSSKDQNRIAFNLGQDAYSDYAKFCQGKYSEMSIEAKGMITAYSGLMHNQMATATGRPYTDGRLLALSSIPNDRKAIKNLIEELIGETLPEHAELVSVPSEREFIDDDYARLNQFHNIPQNSTKSLTAGSVQH